MEEVGRRRDIHVVLLVELAATVLFACASILLGAINDRLFEVLLLSTASCVLMLVVTFVVWCVSAMLRRR
jgi:hypothetical protein